MPIGVYTSDLTTKVKTLLSAPNWSAGTEPQIEKWVDEVAQQVGTFDYVMIKVPDDNARVFELFATGYLHTLPVIIKVNTATSEARALAIVNEVIRLITANVRLTDYVDLVYTGARDNSLNMRNMWEYHIFATARKHDTV